MDCELKYYIYVSESKVEMLYAQIPRPFLEGLSGELKVSLGIVSTSLQQQAQTQTLYSKLRAVLGYLEGKESIGSVSKPQTYFKGKSSMRWGYLGENQELVLFTGKADRTVFALGGSSANVLGAVGSSTVPSVSTTPFIVKSLASELHLEPLGPSELDSLRALKERDPVQMMSLGVAHAEKYMQGPLQEVEFFAKRLMYEELSPHEPSTLLGTPLYVALAE